MSVRQDFFQLDKNMSDKDKNAKLKAFWYKIREHEKRDQDVKQMICKLFLELKYKNFGKHVQSYMDEMVPLEKVITNNFVKEADTKATILSLAQKMKASQQAKEPFKMEKQLCDTLAKEANIYVLIRFIGYMVKYVMEYREEMFKYEDFKQNIKKEDHILILTQYELKAREYIRKFNEMKLLMDMQNEKGNDQKQVWDKIKKRTENYLKNQKEDILKANKIVEQKEELQRKQMAQIAMKNEKIKSFKERLEQVKVLDVKIKKLHIAQIKNTIKLLDKQTAESTMIGKGFETIMHILNKLTKTKSNISIIQNEFQNLNQKFQKTITQLRTTERELLVVSDCGDKLKQIIPKVVNPSDIIEALEEKFRSFNFELCKRELQYKAFGQDKRQRREWNGYVNQRHNALDFQFTELTRLIKDSVKSLRQNEKIQLQKEFKRQDMKLAETLKELKKTERQLINFKRENERIKQFIITRMNPAGTMAKLEQEFRSMNQIVFDSINESTKRVDFLRKQASEKQKQFMVKNVEEDELKANQDIYDDNDDMLEKLFYDENEKSVGIQNKFSTTELQNIVKEADKHGRTLFQQIHQKQVQDKKNKAKWANNKSSQLLMGKMNLKGSKGNVKKAKYQQKSKVRYRPATQRSRRMKSYTVQKNDKCYWLNHTTYRKRGPPQYNMQQFKREKGSWTSRNRYGNRQRLSTHELKGRLTDIEPGILRQSARTEGSLGHKRSRNGSGRQHRSVTFSKK